ncbi:MAG: hypothetical protein V1911_02145, partial [Candidatus Micrarchaeota archaeon]
MKGMPSGLDLQDELEIEAKIEKKWVIVHFSKSLMPDAATKAVLKKKEYLKSLIKRYAAKKRKFEKELCKSEKLLASGKSLDIDVQHLFKVAVDFT